MDPVRVLLVDDDERYVRTLAAFLRTHDDIDVIGTLGTGRDAIDEFELLRPDVVVMDAYMPETDGIEATRAIVAVRPDARIIILTAHDTADLKARALKAGAAAFLAKQNAARDLPAEIRLVATEVAQAKEPYEPIALVRPSGDAAGAPGTPATRPPEIVVTVSVSFHGGGVVAAGLSGGVEDRVLPVRPGHKHYLEGW